MPAEQNNLITRRRSLGLLATGGAGLWVAGWHCNASGVYPDISSERTIGQTYLRGVQLTDKHGRASFKSIFPGHYSGRTTHIHARIHINSHDTDHKLAGGHICHTGQMFPPEAVYREVYKRRPTIPRPPRSSPTRTTASGPNSMDARA
jgi:protocatechuate 3,4-dioxygenase beta subunit